MKTKLLIAALSVAFVGVVVAACGDDKKKDSSPTFEEPNAAAVQQDRKGRPAIATIIKVGLSSGASADAFNSVGPAVDVATFSSALPALGAILHLCPISALAGGAALLPDILTIDTSAPTGYLNGRGLEDDVIDGTLGAVYGSNGTPCVPTAFLTDTIDANDKAFLATFPYLAAPF